MSVLGIEWATVVPAPDELAQTARELLDVAGDPALVRTDGNGTEFRVPVSIAEEWHRRRNPEPEPVTPPEPKPVQRRGRAPRVPTEE
jgi:hypothetical protein